MTPLDTVAFAAALVGLALTSVLACLGPALRAAGTDPVVTFRKRIGRNLPMKFGVNTCIWGSAFGPADFHLLPRLKASGFDGVECRF